MGNYSTTSTIMFAGAFSFGLPLFFSIRALVTTTLSRFTRFFEPGDVGSSCCFDPAQPILVFSLLYAHYAFVLVILLVLVVGSTFDPPKALSHCIIIQHYYLFIIISKLFFVVGRLALCSMMKKAFLLPTK